MPGATQHPRPGLWLNATCKAEESHVQPPAPIRFLPRQRNWSDGGTYPAMISLVQRVPGDDDHCCLGARAAR